MDPMSGQELLRMDRLNLIFKVRLVAALSESHLIPSLVSKAEESERDEKIKNKLLKDPHPSSKAQLQQFFRAKEDERLEKLVEEQFKLQEQKQLAQEKEAELKLQQQVLQRQKEKLKQAEKHLSNKVTRQTAARQKRRPVTSVAPRRQRTPNYSGHSPVRTVTNKDGTYRVSFNVQ